MSYYVIGFIFNNLDSVLTIVKRERYPPLLIKIKDINQSVRTDHLRF